MRYLVCLLCFVALAGLVGAQCYTPGVIYHHPVIVPPPGVLIHSRVIEPTPAPAPVQAEPAKPAEAPKPPEGCADGCKVEATEEDQDGPQVLNFGVQLGKLGGPPRYRLNGQEVSREQAIAAIGDPIPDDVGLYRLTLIGPKEDRARVMADLDNHPGLKGLKSSLLVQGYDPDDSRVSKRGFVTTGKPSIYLMDPAGKVLARNLDGEYPGADALAYAVGEVIGKPYSPDADKPLPKKPEPAPIALPKSINDIPQWAWLAGAGALVFFLLRKQGGAQ